MQTKQAKRQRKRNTLKNSEPTDTKKEQLIHLLQRPDGATMDDLITGSGWQAHSVRGFLSGVLGKKMGMKVTSEARDGEQRVYRIAKFTSLLWSEG